VLKFVPQANLTSLDPIWTTANITRNHGHMIYDSLYGVDADFRPQPQMAAGHVVDQDGKRVTITLRDETGAPKQRWQLRNVFPMKYTGPSLNAKGGQDVAMEELVLSAEQIDFEAV
jgi:hypothetical protein